MVILQTQGLDASGLYALCYADDAYGTVNSLWQDSYIRFTLQKLKAIQAAGATINTFGTLPMINNLHIEYTGSLGTGKWLSFVNVAGGGDDPCSTVTSTPDSQHSGIHQAGGAKSLTVTTSSLAYTEKYAVCYSEDNSSWRDSGIRLRFVKWSDAYKTRVVSASSTTFAFDINTGILEGDIVALLPADSNCSLASAAPWLSDGVAVKRSVSAAGLVELTTTDSVALQEGKYIMCICNRNGLSSETCENANNAYINIEPSLSHHIKIISPPRLGNVSSPGDIRAVSQHDTNFYIKGSSDSQFSIESDDTIFFAQACDQIPSVNLPNQTAAMSLSDFSAATLSAKVVLPSTLESDGSTTRTLRACFATKEANASINGYVTVAESLSIITRPRLGVVDSPGTIRALTLSNADFNVYPFAAEDLLYFSNTSCGVPPASGDGGRTAILPSSVDAATQVGTFALPPSNSTAALTAIDSSTQRTLKACFAGKGTDTTVSHNWIELQDELKILPDPSSALGTVWKQGQVLEMLFNQPAGNSAIEGDIVILQKDSCVGVHTIVIATSNATTSAPVVLAAGGVAREFPIAAGKVNELNVGFYKVCFATGSSGGDSQADFSMLAAELEIQESLDTTAPILSLPQSILLGVDLVATWAASSEMEIRAAAEGAWVGLYKANQCNEDNEWRHQCYLAYRNLPSGSTAGEIRFLSILALVIHSLLVVHYWLTHYRVLLTITDLFLVQVPAARLPHCRRV